MAISPTPQIKQYRDRQVDLAMYYGMSAAAGDQQLTQLMVRENESGAVVTGIQKLAQRFAVELLTDLSSLRYLPHRGTTFILDAKRGYWRTPADVEQSFYGALLRLANNLISEENVDDPPDEKYQSARLLNVALTPDTVSIRVHLVSRAGTSREIIYPLHISSFGLSA